jgi:hypothetical protein
MGAGIVVAQDRLQWLVVCGLGGSILPKGHYTAGILESLLQSVRLR